MLLVHAQKFKRRAAETISIFLDTIYIIMNKHLIERQVIKAILVTCKMEMRNMILGTGNVMLFIKG